jgi:tripartite-type tricarboxylate transporter receptor subunit TctC
MNELYPGFLSIAWFGIVAPPRTPSAIAEKMSLAVSETLRMPDVLKRLSDLSADPIGGTPAQMAKLLKEDAVRWREAIRAAGVTPGNL